MKITLSILFVLACCATSVQAATFDCVAPVFPGNSTSNEGVRRVEKQVKKWRACYDAYRVTPGATDVSKLDAEVNANLAKWTAATRAYSNGQGNSQNIANRAENTMPVSPRAAALERSRIVAKTPETPETVAK
ncbi:MAG: hypothetical protein V4631_21555 [Pseudomonadota bacterium]